MSQQKTNLEDLKIILLATHNPSKIRRFQKNLKIPKVEFVSPRDLNLLKVEAKEDGKDEFVNSEIKARAYFEVAKIPCLSLDTGFYIQDLPDNKQPAKHVQRIAGVLETDSDEIRFQKMTDHYRQIAKNKGGQAEAFFKDVFCLFNGKKVDTGNVYRVIIAERKEKITTTRSNNKGKVRKKENIFVFITNNMELSPKEIAQIYKQRWDIEVFFRFIKQELNASHFISVSKNGITVMLYMTLIAAMLLQIYKKINGLGYKTAKRRFSIELWETLITIIVKECGGNPERINKGYFGQFSIP